MPNDGSDARIIWKPSLRLLVVYKIVWNKEQKTPLKSEGFKASMPHASWLHAALDCANTKFRWRMKGNYDTYYCDQVAKGETKNRQELSEPRQKGRVNCLLAVRK